MESHELAPKQTFETQNVNNLEHMAVYSRALLSNVMDKMPESVQKFATRTRETAPALGAAATIALGATAVEVASTSPDSAAAETSTAKKQIIKMVETSSEEDFKYFDRYETSKYRRMTLRSSPSNGGFENDKNKIGSLKYREYDNGAVKFVWRHKPTVKVYAIREQLSHGMTRYTMNYRPKSRTGGSIYQKPVPEGQQNLENRTHLTLYIKKR